jgi:hypothetical protein
MAVCFSYVYQFIVILSGSDTQWSVVQYAIIRTLVPCRCHGNQLRVVRRSWDCFFTYEALWCHRKSKQCVCQYGGVASPLIINNYFAFPFLLSFQSHTSRIIVLAAMQRIVVFAEEGQKGPQGNRLFILLWYTQRRSQQFILYRASRHRCPWLGYELLGSFWAEKLKQIWLRFATACQENENENFITFIIFTLFIFHFKLY